jgi:uncharacterized protein
MNARTHTASAVRWAVTELSDVAARTDLDTWEDPVGRTRVWSRPDFRRATEELPPHRALQLVAFDHRGPRMFVPLLLSEHAGGLLFYDVPAMAGDERAFGDSARLGADEHPNVTATELEDARTAAYPSLAAGSYGAHHGILVHPAADAAERASLLEGLPTAVAEAAEELRCASHALLYLTPELLRATASPDSEYRTAVLGAESVLECSGDSWGDYLASLSTRRRSRVWRERRAYGESDVVSEIRTGPDALGEDLIEMRANLRIRHGMPPDRERSAAEFRSLARWCGDRVVVNRAWRDGTVVGFVVLLVDGDTVYARTAGFDYERLSSHHYCYFNLVYYDVLEWGLPRGIRRLELGLSAYPAKRTRGCGFEPRFGLFSFGPDNPLERVLRAQDTGERRRLVQECGSGMARTDLDVTEGTPWM